MLDVASDSACPRATVDLVAAIIICYYHSLGITYSHVTCVLILNLSTDQRSMLLVSSQAVAEPRKAESRIQDLILKPVTLQNYHFLSLLEVHIISGSAKKQPGHN